MDAGISRFVDALPGLVWTALPDGSVDFINRQWIEYTGLDVDALRGRGWQTAIHPADLAELSGRWESLVASATSGEMQVRLRRLDGEYHWFELRMCPSLDDRGGVSEWYGLGNEIDELKRTTAALRASERELQQLIDGVPGYIAIADAQGHHVYASKPALARSRRTLEQLRGLGFIDTVHPDEQETVKMEWLRCVAAGIPMELDHRMSMADGSYRCFHVRVEPFRDEDGQIVRWYGLLTDVDDQRRTEAALRESERHLRLVVETIPALVSRWTADGVLDYVNRRAFDYFGLELARIGPDVMHPDDREEHFRNWRLSLQSGEPFEGTHRLRRPDGEYRWFYERVEPLRDQAGGVVCWYSVNIDIHDSREMEEIFRATRRKLAAAMQMATVAQMSATIAHEISQPISGILTNAGTCMRMLAASPPDVDGARETVRRAMRDADRASDVITRLRALFAKKDACTDPMDLNEATRQVVALSSAELLKNGVSVHMEMDEEIPAVLGDRVQLQQVILNLIMNAVESMSEVQGRQRKMVIKTAKGEDGSVSLAVRDTGTGIDPNGLDRLFEPFFTTKSSGMGIGLSVSMSIIESHHGQLWATPNSGPGATFSFSVPSASR